MLPVLNWSAARASDVVVHVLGEWAGQISELSKDDRPRLFCNTRHLQIASLSSTSARIEWVGEQRQPKDGAAIQEFTSLGSSEEFDIVALAVGFGPERNRQLSY